MATEAPPQSAHRRASIANPDTAPAGVPEFLRIKEASRLFSVSRSWIYQAIVEKRVKSYSVREPHKTRGVRLIEASSLRELIRSTPDE